MFSQKEKKQKEEKQGPKTPRGCQGFLRWSSPPGGSADIQKQTGRARQTKGIENEDGEGKRSPYVGTFLCSAVSVFTGLFSLTFAG